ncbi:hypothetical protein ABZ079_36545 [Streptomyces sp. NPDC006314]|uniref:hypothetical protein n=1 Tax=Streptomyces sp. NPDC006314 TaxID=3154475 RepID=UPI0033B65C6F
MQNAIRAARTPHAAARDDAPAAAHTEDHHDQASDPPHAVDHPGRDAVLTPAQRATAVQAHQQAAMPEEYLEGCTTDPATWLRTPENLERLATFTRAANARRRAFEARLKPEEPADVVKPADQYEDAHPAILAWTQSKAADRGMNELSLSDLQAMMAS